MTTGVTASEGIGRTVRLLANFRYEQADPPRYYRPLASDAVAMLERYQPVAGRRVIDVGGGPGYVADAFRAAGADAVNVDRDPAELRLHDRRPCGAVLADGHRLPFADGTVDVVCSFNTLEHDREPWNLLAELVRVTAVGGLLFLAVTNWYSPYGGHEASPWHYLGGQRAARRYTRRHGRPPKDQFGGTLFKIHVADLLRWARDQSSVELVDARPRYYPPWARSLLRVPGLREVLTWNLALIARRTPA